MNMDTTCLVTGGAGFIGSHLCDALIEKGYRVICVDNLITGNARNVAHLHTHPQFHFIKQDVTTPISATLRQKISGVSYIYHLASPASPPQYKKYSIETLLTNAMGTYIYLELARTIHARFLLASTSEVYGNPLEHPQKETYFGNVNPNGTRACYDEAKRFAEALTMEFVRKYKLPCRIVRIFNTYGPRMEMDDGRVISNFITQALKKKPLTMYGDGSQTRSFCYVSDMVDGLMRIMEKDGIDGEVINLGNPEEQTIRDVGRAILAHTKSQSQLLSAQVREQDDPIRRKPDIGKAEKLLGWRPHTQFLEGLTKTIEYFRSVCV